MTRYEIVATSAGKAPLLIGYTPRVSRPGLLDAMRKYGEAVVAALGIGEDDIIEWRNAPRPHALIAGWKIGFSGRTQLEARTFGEHPFVGGQP